MNGLPIVRMSIWHCSKPYCSLRVTEGPIDIVHVLYVAETIYSLPTAASILRDTVVNSTMAYTVINTGMYLVAIVETRRYKVRIETEEEIKWLDLLFNLYGCLCERMWVI